MATCMVTSRVTPPGPTLAGSRQLIADGIRMGISSHMTIRQHVHFSTEELNSASITYNLRANLCQKTSFQSLCMHCILFYAIWVKITTR